MSAETILTVENLFVEFDNQPILERVNFSVRRGEILAVVGPNGAGKSVLFRALLDLVPHSGKVDWLPEIHIGYVPQKLAVERNLPLTVREFLQLKPGKASGAECLRALEAVGIKTGPAAEHHLEHHILNRPLGILSGGEFQRVLIAWALIGRPAVLLFDEPTAGVDTSGEETIYKLLHQLQERDRLTIILISHDLHIVYKYANQVLCLNKTLVCSGPPKEVLSSDSLTKLYGQEAALYDHPHALHH